MTTLLPPGPANLDLRTTARSLREFAARQDNLALEIRLKRLRARSLGEEILALSSRISDAVARVEKSYGNGHHGMLSDGRDYRRIVPTLRQQRRDLENEAIRLEAEADELWRQRLAEANLRQCEAHDYREYLSQGLPLPADRQALYLEEM